MNGERAVRVCGDDDGLTVGWVREGSCDISTILFEQTDLTEGIE